MCSRKFRSLNPPGRQPQSITNHVTLLQLTPQLVTGIGRNFQVRLQPIPVPVNLPVWTQHTTGIIRVVGQKHITKTNKKKGTRKIRWIYNRMSNQPFGFEDWKLSCSYKAAKEAHLKSRCNYVSSIYENVRCHNSDIGLCSKGYFERQCR